MNILFLFPSVKLDMTVNHGIASLCGIIKNRGHEVDLYHFNQFNEKELGSILSKNNYSLCLISSVTNQWPYALSAAKSVKNHSDIPIIAGGHHVTHYPDILEENCAIDGICLGEGDTALLQLLEKMNINEDFHSIQNCCFRKSDNGKIIRNEVGNLIENLDELPAPDYSVFSKRTVLNYPALMFSRGCPYNCTYCCNNSLRNLYKGKGKYIRTKSVRQAIHEVDTFIHNFNPPALNFDDDTFIKNIEWLYAFLDEYKKLTNIPFNCNTRPETINEDLCKKLKEANCNIISIGIESGSEQIRKKIMKRHMSNSAIRNAFDVLKKHNIKTSSFNMVGIPDETYEDYRETVKLNREIAPNRMQISIYYPYLGTDLGNYAKEKGMLPENSGFSHSYFSASILNMRQFPKWKIKCSYLFFHFNVFKKKSIFKALYYLVSYNVLKNAYIKKKLKTLLRK